MAEDGQPDRTVVRGHYHRLSDYQASTTDPDAALMATKTGGRDLGYHDHYVVDGGSARIILNVLVTPADVMENQPMLDLLWSACFHWHLLPDQVELPRFSGATSIQRLARFQELPSRRIACRIVSSVTRDVVIPRRTLASR